MSVNAYLVIDGVQGGSTSKKGAIDLLSFSFGAAMPTSTSADGGLRAGRADVSHVSVMKVLDKTSPDLFQNCVTGDFLKKVDIVYDKAMGTQQEDYYKLSMENALITSIQWSGSNENPTESITFAFKKIQVCYNPEEDGALKGFVQKGFDTETIKGF
jgi:type VI secretion system secreted protein Hcp